MKFRIIGLTVRWSPYKIKNYTINDVSDWNTLNGGAVIYDGKNYKEVYTRILIQRIK